MAVLSLAARGAHVLGVPVFGVATFTGTVGGSDTRARNFLLRPVGRMLLLVLKSTEGPSRGETAQCHQTSLEVRFPLRHVGRM